MGHVLPREDWRDPVLPCRQLLLGRRRHRSPVVALVGEQVCRSLTVEILPETKSSQLSQGITISDVFEDRNQWRRVAKDHSVVVSSRVDVCSHMQCGCTPEAIGTQPDGSLWPGDTRDNLA